ncbi:longitudinals lacking [Carabus blaptoides fortunei]
MECGKEPSFYCHLCPYRAYQKTHVKKSELENPITKKRRIKVISVEHIKDNKIVGKLKEELSTHLSFDKIKICKQVNKKIVDKEISLHKISSQSQMKLVNKESESAATRITMKKNIAASRMEKFLTMTAADCRDQLNKNVPLACLNPVLKTPKDTLRCIHCNVLYDPAKKLEHLKVCTKSKPVVPSYGCLQCSFKSISQEDAAQHTEPLGSFNCARCGNTYSRQHSLKRHMRFECGVEPRFECPVCHKKSKHKHNLLLHMRIHRPPSKQNNDDDALGSNTVNMMAHQETLQIVRYSCRRCCRVYSNKSNLRRHIRLECGVVPQYECQKCKKRFKHSHHLFGHQKQHESENV